MLGVLFPLFLGIATLSEGRLVLFGEEKTWPEARLTCGHHGGQLAALNLTGNITDVESQVGAPIQEAWTGNLRTLEPFNLQHYAIPYRNALADSSRYECGYVIPVNVTMVGQDLRLTALYNYQFGSKPCTVKESFLCYCESNYYGNRLFAKVSGGKWKDIYYGCQAQSKAYGHCELWAPEPQSAHTINVTMAESGGERYLRVNKTYWIQQIFQLKETNDTGNIQQSTRCGKLTVSTNTVQFRTCNEKSPFLCDIADDTYSESTVSPDIPTTTEPANSTNTTNSTANSTNATTEPTSATNATTNPDYSSSTPYTTTERHNGQGKLLSSPRVAVTMAILVALAVH